MQTPSPRQVHNPTCMRQRLCHSMYVRVEDEYAPSDGDGGDAVQHDTSRSGNLFV